MENNLPMANALLRAQLEISTLSQIEGSKQTFIRKSLQILTETEVVRDAFFRSSKTLHSLYNHEVPDYSSLRSIMSNKGDLGKLPGEDDLYILKIGNDPGELSFIGLKMTPGEADYETCGPFFKQIIVLFSLAINRFDQELIRRQYERELNESNDTWKMLAKNTADIIIQCELDGIVREYNHLGIDEKEINIQGHLIYDGVHPDDLQKMIDAVSKSIETNETQQTEFRGKKWLGDKIYHIQIRPILFLNKNKRLNMTLTDYTENRGGRKKHQNQLLLLDMVLDGTQNGIILTDKNNVIEYGNRYFAMLFHLDMAAISGNSLFDLFDSDQQEIIKRETEKRIKGQTTSFELVSSSPGDIKDTFLVFSSPRFDSEGNFLGSFQSFSNITKYKELEKTISHERSKLRELSKHLLTVREEERLYLSREIHDEMGQQLTAVLMSLKYQKSRSPLSQELSAEIDRIINVIQEMLTRTKSLAGLLYPIMLDDLGLIASLEWLCEEMLDKSKIPVRLKISGDDDSLGSKVKITVYRIFQEALSNAVRYSESKDIHLSMEILPNIIRGDIADRGIGFRYEEADSTKFYGIIGMEERIKTVKGNIEIRSRPGRGTSVKFSIPLGEN